MWCNRACGKTRIRLSIVSKPRRLKQPRSGNVRASFQKIRACVRRRFRCRKTRVNVRYSVAKRRRATSRLMRVFRQRHRVWLSSVLRQLPHRNEPSSREPLRCKLRRPQRHLHQSLSVGVNNHAQHQRQHRKRHGALAKRIVHRHRSSLSFSLINAGERPAANSAWLRRESM